MKKILISFCLAAAFLFAGKLEVNAQSWHQLSQGQRNQRILTRGLQDAGRYVGLDCKNWLQARVVWEASGYTVWLPLTMPDVNGWYWAPQSNVSAMPQPFPIQWAVPGQIVQMKLRSGMAHTAIIGGFAGNGVWFLDSNWYYKTAPNVVNFHLVSYTDFYNSVAAYTVYSIL